MKKITFILPALLTVLVFSSASCQQAKEVPAAVITSVSTQDFKKMVDTKEGVLLDVRTAEEFSEGHIPGAVNIDFNGENFKQEIEKLDKSKKYDVYCRSGKRSMGAANMMEEMGFKNITNLEGGILGWQQAGFEVVK